MHESLIQRNFLEQRNRENICSELSQLASSDIQLALIFEKLGFAEKLQKKIEKNTLKTLKGHKNI